LAYFLLYRLPNRQWFPEKQRQETLRYFGVQKMPRDLRSHNPERVMVDELTEIGRASIEPGRQPMGPGKWPGSTRRKIFRKKRI
jgi:hypothetical protein